ncbi:MAG: flippase [Muribaculaceae bacterium]|nr:flippase [Muribaculaceae bacterium]
MGNKMNNMKSIKVNAILNSIQTVLKFIFPLIIFPYVSRILGTEQLGRYNFSNSVISYFILIADAGVKTYAVREGAKIRNNKKEITKFSNEVFSINLYTTLFSYLCLILVLFFSVKVRSYGEIIIVLSFQIILITLGRSWLFNIYEDFFYITIRNICFQIISMILLFCIVKNSNDVFKYAIIVTVAAVGNEVLNMFISRKYSRIHFAFSINKEHIKPLIYLFSTTLSITIYQSSDIIMLGFIGTDYNVGIYSVSVKIYNILKQLVAAILFVTIPRFSYYLGKKLYDEYQNLFTKVFNFLTLVLLPASVGLIMVSQEVILLFAGQAYRESVLSLILLSIAMILNLYSYMLGYCVILPNGEEKYFFWITLFGAIVNISLNIIMMPVYLQNAAAFSTIVAEASTLLLGISKAKKLIRFKGVFGNLICTMAGCIWIIIVGVVVHLIFDNVYYSLSIIILLSILGYFMIQICLKNQIIWESISIGIAYIKNRKA